MHERNNAATAEHDSARIPDDFEAVMHPELAFVRPGARQAVALMFQDADGKRHVMELNERQALTLAMNIIRLVNTALRGHHKEK